MRRIILSASVALMSMGVAHAAAPTAYYAVMKVALLPGQPAIIGAKELSVTLYSPTPFKKNACTAGTLYAFDDGVDTPQTIVYGYKYTNYYVSFTPYVCRDASGKAYQAVLYFSYQNSTLSNSYNIDVHYYPGSTPDAQPFEFVSFFVNHGIANSAGNNIIPTWTFYSR